ncbi:MAG: EFR1 family ferrodoxin [Atopobiaceae bacterium]|jgi:ferredoxin|nr:EFR1 family ferrodoxin [Atopobiaceae bacterium]MCI2174143.1 EFR1 family ferrodoxin [Atopobiaceae bacterium]MCI2206784.1 EFR1 family ferrodoxin [Atopobiaceae bacterium]
MIMYFSASGNSRFVAERLAHTTGDELVCLNDRIKRHDTSELVSDVPFVLVCPIFAWRVPRIVAEHLSRTTLTGSREAYLLVTTCGSSGNAGAWAERDLRERGMTLLGWHTSYMLGDYVAFMQDPDVARAPAVNRRVADELEALAPLVRERRPLPTQEVTVLDRFMSRFANPFFYRHIIGRPGFHVTDACVGCGTCAAVCPLNDIGMHDGGDGHAVPAWGDDCTHCMACVHRCPTQAVEWRDVTVGKARYYNRGEM